MTQFRAGKFIWTVEGRDVIQTKDDGPSIITVQLYTYRDYARAIDAARNMARRHRFTLALDARLVRA